MKEVNVMNVLVLIAHPHLKNSRVNRRWKQGLEGVANVTIHDLYAQYPDECIDVKREQSLLLSHDRIVFQFPFTGIAHRRF
jgi:glutathione-regulated potassium-efflux system ancillary protein KefG